MRQRDREFDPAQGRIDLGALTWLGRGDYGAEDWAAAHNDRTATYLLGTPLVGDFLEEGLAMLGYARGDYEIERL